MSTGRVMYINRERLIVCFFKTLYFDNYFPYDKTKAEKKKKGGGNRSQKAIQRSKHKKFKVLESLGDGVEGAGCGTQ